MNKEKEIADSFIASLKEIEALYNDHKIDRETAEKRADDTLDNLTSETKDLEDEKKETVLSLIIAHQYPAEENLFRMFQTILFDAIYKE